MIFTHASLLARKTAHFALANSFVFGVYGYQILGESEGGANEDEEGEKRGENVHFGWFFSLEYVGSGCVWVEGRVAFGEERWVYIFWRWIRVREEPWFSGG
jgi:hypothetical protein